MTLPPLRTRLVLAALAIAVAAGVADWTLLMPDDPFDAWMGTAIAGGSATALILPFLLGP